MAAIPRDRLERYLRARDERPATPERGIARRAPGVPVPLSIPQQHLWLHAMLAADAPVYNEAMTVVRRGPLDVAALEAALAEILRRHEAWRMAFPLVDGQPMQHVLPATAVDLPVVDLRGLPAAQREAEALRLATEDAMRPFDLARGPLVRPLLVRVDDEEHRLFLTLHHIVFDGVAIYRVFMPELTALYTAFVAGEPSPLPDPPIQYGDFTLWQRARAATPEVGRQVECWKRKLGGAPRLELTTDRPRPSAPGFRGAFERLRFSPELSEALRAYSREHHVTLFMTMLAAFQILLMRYSGQDEFVVGTVVAGRKRPELERLLGYFLNPIAVRADVSGDPAVGSFLERVRDTMLEMLSNDEAPFEQVVAAVRPERDARNPLFEAMFAMEPPMPDLPAGWQYSQLDVDTGAAKFDLYLELDDRADGIIGRFTYRTDLFDRETITRMTRHYETLLRAILADPERQLSALPLLDEAERRTILVEWNETARDFPRDTGIHRVFEAQAARTPDAVALALGEARMTYRELDQRANRLAHYLRARGVGDEALVGVAMDRSFDMIVALLGVLKAGAAHVPLDPAYPRERLAFMLEDAGVAALLTERRLIADLPPAACPRICLDADWAAIARESSEAPAVGGGGDRLAYAIYTSGSTGRPKGVAVQHAGVLRLLFGVDYVRLDPTTVLLHLGSTSFDVSMFEIWAPLLHGGVCVLFPARVPTHRALGEAIAKYGVNTLWLTASLFNTVVDEAPDILAGISQLLIGGEALSVPHVRRAYEVLPATTIVNGYGPTEATVFACCYRIPNPPDTARGSIPIGRPIANTEAYVLDRGGQPVPVGVTGELYLGGPGVARGYLNRPELTADKFVPHPFRPESGDRVYRTGDLVRWLPDGTLDFIGRVDGQVKVRGFRIEPGEIEAVLRQHPAVRDAAVTPRPAAGGADKVLVAYVVPEGQDVDVGALRAYLRQKLPAHMIPAAFVPLRALPLTPSGKIDRLALPAPDGTAQRATFVEARGPLGCQLTEVWEELLGVHPVGATDDFFDLGGTSLSAVRLVQRLEQLYGVRLPLARLYEAPTIDQLAWALLQHESGAFQAPLAVVQRGAPGRRPFFFFHGDVNGGGFYCLALARLLGAEQPVYAVHPLGLDGQPMPSTIEAMAAAHVDAVRAVQPHGPYLLGGYCNGGLLAYETARRLRAAGEEVRLLALVAAVADRRLRIARSVMAGAARLARLAPETALDYFARMRLFAYRLAERSGRERAAFVLHGAVKLVRELTGRAVPDRLAPDGDERLLVSNEMFETYLRAVLAYVPRSYDGPVVLFWPTAEAAPYTNDPTMGWGRLAASVTVYPVPGDHDGIVTRHVHLIAERLRACLARD